MLSALILFTPDDGVLEDGVFGASNSRFACGLKGTTAIEVSAAADDVLLLAP